MTVILKSLLFARNVNKQSSASTATAIPPPFAFSITSMADESWIKWAEAISAATSRLLDSLRTSEQPATPTYPQREWISAPHTPEQPAPGAQDKSASTYSPRLDSPLDRHNSMEGDAAIGLAEADQTRTSNENGREDRDHYKEEPATPLNYSDPESRASSSRFMETPRERETPHSHIGRNHHPGYSYDQEQTYSYDGFDGRRYGWHHWRSRSPYRRGSYRTRARRGGSHRPYSYRLSPYWSRTRRELAARYHGSSLRANRTCHSGAWSKHDGIHSVILSCFFPSSEFQRFLQVELI